MPWILYAAMLMTEVAAYPAFLWALLALDRATVRPSARATCSRSRPRARLLRAHRAARARAVAPARDRLLRDRPRAPSAAGRGLRAGPARRRQPPAARGRLRAALVVAGVVGRRRAARRRSSASTATTRSSNTSPAGPRSARSRPTWRSSRSGSASCRSSSGRLAARDLVRPDAGRERHAFACVAGSPCSRCSRPGERLRRRYTGFVHDRFLLYLVPPVLIGMCCALDEAGCRAGRSSHARARHVWASRRGFPGVHLAAVPDADAGLADVGAPAPIVGVTGRSARRASRSRRDHRALRAAPPRRAPARRGRARPRDALFTLAALVATTVATFAQFFGTLGWSLPPADGLGERRLRLDRPDASARTRASRSCPTSSRATSSSASSAGATSSSGTSPSCATRSPPTAPPTPTPASGSRSSTLSFNPTRGSPTSPRPPGSPRATRTRASRSPAARARTSATCCCSGRHALASRVDLLGPLRRRLDAAGRDRADPHLPLPRTGTGAGAHFAFAVHAPRPSQPVHVISDVAHWNENAGSRPRR